MRHRFGAALLALAVLLAPAPSSFAHHSVSGQFDQSKPLTLKGVISKVDWINPHVYLYLDVKEDNGTVTNWALASLPTAMMRRAGLTKELISGKPGEVVTVNGIRAREEGRHLVWISKITYEDGHFHQFTGQ